MDGENRSSTPKKPRFTPKAPPRRKPKLVLPNDSDDGHSASAQEMLRRFNEAHRRPLPPKLEQEGPSQINQISSTHSSSPSLTPSGDKNILSLPSAGSTSSTEMKLKKDYVEPWDYHHSNYPTTLPWRRPYSGDPDVLNAEEFGGGDSMQLDFEEPALDSASELGLLKENENPELFLVQLPPVLPMPKQRRILKGKAIPESEPIGSSGRGSASVHPSVKAKEIASRTIAIGRGRGAGAKKEEEKPKFDNLDEFPGGYLGKMIVYKSGKIQLKIGEILHDVSSGSDVAFPQEAVAINTEQKTCCALGDVKKRIVVTSDVDFMLDSS